MVVGHLCRGAAGPWLRPGFRPRRSIGGGLHLAVVGHGGGRRRTAGPSMPAVIWMDSRGNKAIRRVAGGPVNVLGYDPRKILRWVQVTGGAPGLSGKDPVVPHPVHPRRLPRRLPATRPPSSSRSTTSTSA